MTEPVEQVRHTTVLDDDTRRVARVYAEALLAAADKGGQAAAVLEDLGGLVGAVFARDPRLEAFFASAAVGRERKAEAVRRAFPEGGLLANFLLVLNVHERLDTLRAVAWAYRELYDKKAGRMRVRVESAAPLDEGQQERLRQELRESFHREPVLETRVNPDLLGGLVVRVDDWVFDASVRTRLENIQRQLIERSSYEIQSGRNRFSA
jgi:F-type H+-transporting ATPase subunit delta